MIIINKSLTIWNDYKTPGYAWHFSGAVCQLYSWFFSIEGQVWDLLQYKDLMKICLRTEDDMCSQNKPYCWYFSITAFIWGYHATSPSLTKANNKNTKQKARKMMVLFRYGERLCRAVFHHCLKLLYGMQLSSEVCSMVLQSLSRPQGSSTIVMLCIFFDFK